MQSDATTVQWPPPAQTSLDDVPLVWPKQPSAPDALAAFFESNEGVQVWEHWIPGKISQGQIQAQHGKDIWEAVLASELLLKNSAGQGSGKGQQNAKGV